MRKILLNLIVPSLVLMCMLTVSCKEQTGITDPGTTSVCSESRFSANEYTDFYEPQEPEPGDESPIRTEDTEEYDILCAPHYEPQSGTMNWSSRDNSTLVRIEAIVGGNLYLDVESMPSPGMSSTYHITVDIPPEALPGDTSLRLTVPEPGVCAFGILVIEDQSSTEPYGLTGMIYLDFKFHGLDLTDISPEDLVLLRWSDRHSRWVQAFGNVELCGDRISGSLELTTLGKFAVGTAL